MGGAAKSNLHLFKQLCGEESLVNVIFATNFWGDVTLQIGERREQELRTEAFFKPALDCGARMTRHYHTAESARSILTELLKTSAKPLLIQQEMVEENKTIAETTVGRQLQGNLERRQEQAAQRWRENKRRAEVADRTQPEEHARSMWQAAGMRAQLEVIRTELDMLNHRVAEEEQNHAQKIQELMEKIVSREDTILQQANIISEAQQKLNWHSGQILNLEKKVDVLEKPKTTGKGMWARLRAALGL